MGQDDSAVYSKHLPPSPRRKSSSHSLTSHHSLQNNLPNEELSEHPLRNSLPEVPTVQVWVPCDTDESTSSPALTESTLEDQLSPDSQHSAARSLSRRRVLSKKTPRHRMEQTQHRAAGLSSGQPSVFVTWEGESKLQRGDLEERQEQTEEIGLLEEIKSMCHISMEQNHNNASQDKS